MKKHTNNNPYRIRKISKYFKRFIPIFVIFGMMLVAYILHLNGYFDFELLKSKRNVIQSFIKTHPVVSPLIYMGIYIISTALSLPGGAILSILGGFLFPQPWATIYIVFAGSTGAIGLFLAAKTALRPFFEKRANNKILQKMKRGFQENAVSYMLFLRLVPLFPFWLVNIAPSIFQVKLSTYYWTTLVGIIPGSFVFAQTGAGLDSFIAKGDDFSMDEVLNWKMRIALISLGILALVPMIFKKIKAHFNHKKHNNI